MWARWTDTSLAFRSSCIRTRGFESHGGHQYERLDLTQKVVVEAQRSVTGASTRLGAGVEAEGVVAELVSKLRSLVDRRHSRRG